MPRFRKKPVEVDAVQFDGTRASIDAICRWANTDPLEDPIVAYNFTNRIDVLDPVVMTLEGDMRISVGDYVIQGVQGEFYPCKPVIFDATYEPVPAAAVPTPEEPE